MPFSPAAQGFRPAARLHLREGRAVRTRRIVAAHKAFLAAHLLPAGVLLVARRLHWPQEPLPPRPPMAAWAYCPQALPDRGIPAGYGPLLAVRRPDAVVHSERAAACSWPYLVSGQRRSPPVMPSDWSWKP
ncbi:hypothetical protein Dimus_016344 [Dionaea muscipula]